MSYTPNINRLPIASITIYPRFRNSDQYVLVATDTNDQTWQSPKAYPRGMVDFIRPAIEKVGSIDPSLWDLWSVACEGSDCDEQVEPGEGYCEDCAGEIEAERLDALYEDSIDDCR